MIKRSRFCRVDTHGRLFGYKHLIPDNLLLYREAYPVELSEERLQYIDSRPFSDRDDLIIFDHRIMLSWEYEGDRFHMVSQPGLVQDGASVPQWLVRGSLVKFGPKVMRAAYVHDNLYALCRVIPRKDCDRIFASFLEHDRCNPVARAKYYSGVRLGGGKPYNAVAPKDHWNYGKVSLTINGREVIA